MQSEDIDAPADLSELVGEALFEIEQYLSRVAVGALASVEGDRLSLLQDAVGLALGLLNDLLGLVMTLLDDLLAPLLCGLDDLMLGYAGLPLVPRRRPPPRLPRCRRLLRAPGFQESLVDDALPLLMISCASWMSAGTAAANPLTRLCSRSGSTITFFLRPGPW